MQQIQERASGVVTTADTPLAHPVHLPQNTGIAYASTEAMSGGLARSSTVHVAIDKGPVAVPDSSGNGFDWTAAGDRRRPGRNADGASHRPRLPPRGQLAA